MERWVNVAEEVPNVPNDYTHNLVLGNGAVQDETEAHENPGQVRRGENEEPQEAESCVRIASRPDVDEGRRERMAKERHRDEW